VDRGCRGMAGVDGPLLEATEMSDAEGIADHESSRRAGIDVAVRHAVYTGVQMLEIHSKTAIFCNYSGRSARLAGGKASSATRCSIRRSDMTLARAARPRTELQWVHRDCNIDFR
jgi:hypothetical protein